RPLPDLLSLTTVRSSALVGITLGPIAELMSAQRVFRCAGDLQIVVHAHTPVLETKFAQQSPDAEQHPARIIADGKHHGVGPPVPDRKSTRLNSSHGSLPS